jgi:hypothetical protein
MQDLWFEHTHDMEAYGTMQVLRPAIILSLPCRKRALQRLSAPERENLGRMVREIGMA